MSRIEFDYKDSKWCILTDMLPYETPIIFSNDGFYKVLIEKSNGNISSWLEGFISRFVSGKNKDYRIPFNYRIRKSGGDGELTLSVMHPAIQTCFAEFYEKYANVVISLCSRSDFTLRAPSALHSSRSAVVTDDPTPIRGKLVDSHGDDEPVETGDANEAELLYPASFFLYKKYNLIHKFYESYEFQRLEKRFGFLLKFDVSKCFYSIYTHSIAWAVKDKKFSKNNIGADSFEARFDEIMQWANYKETNGIIVGPEISRIFAEIILQRIDVDVSNSLQKTGLYAKKDYDVRRYVDDYFVFSKSEATAKVVLEEFRINLEKYKLHINESKTSCAQTPFVSKLTIAKSNVREMIGGMFDALYEADGDTGRKIKELKHGPQLARNVITRLKSASQEYNVPFAQFSSMALTSIKRRLYGLCRKAEGCSTREEQEAAAISLRIIVEVCSYIVAADPRVRTAYVVSQMFIMIHRCISNYRKDVCDSVITKMAEELSLLSLKAGINLGSIERLNLIIALAEISEQHFDESAAVRSYMDEIILECSKYDLDDPVDGSKLNYFCIVSIMYCIKKKEIFNDVRNSLINITVNWLKDTDRPLQRSDLIMLTFDMVSCPYIKKAEKARILSAAISGYPEFGAVSAQKINEYIGDIGKYRWFVEWGQVPIEMLLKKKELRPAYGT